MTQNMKTSELLIRAKALIIDPVKWTQGAYAKNIDGLAIDTDSSDAVCFCSLGALHKANPNTRWSKSNQEEYGSFDIAYNYLDKAIAAVEGKEPIGCLPVASYNDTHEHDEVMLVWDTAIELAIKDGD